MKTNLFAIVEVLYNQSGRKRCQIDNTIVEEAIYMVNNFQVNTPISLFYYLSALNLLNAAIKRNAHKAKLSYEIIKGKVVEIVDYVYTNKARFDNISFYYDKSDICLYINAFDVIFSFHQVIETPIIIQASQFEPIEWKGIRLQQIAQPLFMYAKKEYESHTSGTLSF